MDRRQAKTRSAIFSAFAQLLKQKQYSQITVNEIIEKADVCRSTFYSHFETKEMLIKEMCCEIFDHIFEGTVCEYTVEENSLKDKLAHILYHIKSNKYAIARILPTESGEIFMHYLKEHLSVLFKMHASDFKLRVPEDFFINHLVGSFSEAIKWWIKNDMSFSCKQVADYFMSVTETH